MQIVRTQVGLRLHVYMLALRVYIQVIRTHASWLRVESPLKNAQTYMYLIYVTLWASKQYTYTYTYVHTYIHTCFQGNSTQASILKRKHKIHTRIQIRYIHVYKSICMFEGFLQREFLLLAPIWPHTVHLCCLPSVYACSWYDCECIHYGHTQCIYAVFLLYVCMFMVWLLGYPLRPHTVHLCCLPSVCMHVYGMIVSVSITATHSASMLSSFCLYACIWYDC